MLNGCICMLMFLRECYKKQERSSTYLLKIKSYTLLSELETENYDSGVFEAGGYKWRLSFYPNGDKKNNGSGYVSLYLAIVETNAYPSGWVLNTDFKLFVYDQINDKYLTVQDCDGAIKRFHEMKKEWGFAQLLPLERFKRSSNGYLVNDCCVIGVEVSVINKTVYTGNWESLSMVERPMNDKFTRKIEHFSKLNEDFYLSEAFDVGGIKWKLVVYPKGDIDEMGLSFSFSFFLELADWETHPTKETVNAKYNLKVVDQINGVHVERPDSHRFTYDEKGCYFGYEQFMPLKELHDASKRYIMNDTLIVEVIFPKGRITNAKLDLELIGSLITLGK